MDIPPRGTDSSVLSESQQLQSLRAVFDNSPDLLYVLDANLRVHLCNPSLLRVTRDFDAEGKTLGELGFPEGKVEEHREAFQMTREAGRARCQEIDLFLDRIHFTACTMTPVTLEDRRELVVFYMRDGSPLPTSQHALQESNQRLQTTHQLLRRVTESTSDLIAAVDLDYRFSMLNEAYGREFKRLMGREVHAGDSVHAVMSHLPEQQRALLTCFQLAMQGEIVHQTLELGDPKLEQGVFDLRFYPLRDQQGRVSGAGEIARDVTERVRAETALRESEERFRTLADNISQLVWMADASGNVLWFNQRWIEFTGTSPARMRRRDWGQVVHPEHLKRVVKRLEHSWNTGETWEDVFPMKSADGYYHWFLSRALPIRNERGQVERWFGTHTDVTDQRMAEEALRRADYNKDQFLATLAHELRNPMAPLRSALETLRLSESADARSSELYDMMNRQVDQLVRLVDDLLEVSRITQGKITLRKTRVDISEVVDQAVESCQAAIAEAGHRLHVQMEPLHIVVPGDPLRLTQVLVNLLNNAAKYTESGGDIWLSVRREVATDNGQAVIRVKDTGVGIDPSTFPYLFDSYVQIPRSDVDTLGGLGIGLSIVRTMVELHGGRVRAYSEGRGKGAEFVVTLPLESGDVEEPEMEAPAPATAPVSATKTLVVDDNRDAATTLASLLELLGKEVKVANSGKEALAITAEFKPEVILLDIDMPGMNGYEVAARLEEEPGLRPGLLVALTGFGQDRDRQKTSEAGFDKHLVKPVDLQTLESLYAE